jgi:hypothetical protein
VINPKLKQQIDGMPYEIMLQTWRFAPIGDPLFQGETGEYFAQCMRVKKQNISNEEHVKASKRIGWER